MPWIPRNSGETGHLGAKLGRWLVGRKGFSLAGAGHQENHVRESSDITANFCRNRQGPVARESAEPQRTRGPSAVGLPQPSQLWTPF